MTEGLLIVIVTQIANVLITWFEGRKTRRANQKDNTRTKHEVKQLIKENETNS